METYYGLTKREFLSEEFYKFCQQEFDEARQYLKTCGKPDTEEKKWYVEYYKWNSSFFNKFLDNNRPVHLQV